MQTQNSQIEWPVKINGFREKKRIKHKRYIFYELQLLLITVFSQTTIYRNKI